ncbi:MAG: Rrf2 family transcriptional regulator [Alphaproteobacteria bacterium]|nr:Rrf2 family transcriptional regulator [Alphaproteobacteria bacterium]
MKLNTKGRYAVMALVDIGQNGKGFPVALSDIAERQGISLSYLEQLFAKLRKAGLVDSVRGPGGGYILANGAEKTHVADIVTAVDETMRVTRCKGETAAKGCMKTGTRCLTHDLWEELGQHIRTYLSTVTIADILEKRVKRDNSPVLMLERGAA